jgi:glycosyltransferase involved in cell wall biosynthesis
LISIIIPLYNKELYIIKTLRSVLAQTFQDFEIIIVNDGSTDKSVDEIEKFDDERIRIVGQKNTGVSAARNKGIEESKYDLIAFLDADDEWLPNHLQELLDLKNDFPECQVFATDYKVIDSKDYERYPVNTEVFHFDEKYGVIENYFESAVKTSPPLWTSAVAVNKGAIKEIGAFPVGVRLGEDLLTWAKLADRYDIAYSKTVTAVYNFKAYSEMLDDEPMPDHDDTVGKGLKYIYKTTKRNKFALRKYISLWHRMRSNLYIKNFKRLDALSESMKAIYYNPLMYKNYVILLLCVVPHRLRTWIMQMRLKQQEKGLA